MNTAMGQMSPQRSLRAICAVLVILCTCITFHLLADQPNFNTFDKKELEGTNRTVSSFLLRHKLDVLVENEPTVTKFVVETANKTSAKKDGFLVWNPNCRIADMDPFDRSIKKFLRPAEPIKCSSLAPLTYTTRVADRQVLKVNEGVVSQYLANSSHLQCCLAVVTRVSENNNKVSRCNDFTHEIKLKPTQEFLIVRCRNKATRKRVYINMHAVVHVKAASPVATSSPLDGDPTPAASPDRLNVLLIGIDSMSRLNMLRTMPRTVTHLRHNDWLELRGYNKIGDNTFPNLMAVLTGLNTEQLKTSGCWPSKTFDQCNFIWKEFKKKGYVTAYAEDEPFMGTFNYHKEGFKAPPTDYYFRPFILEAYRHLPTKKRDILAVCLGPTSTTEHFLRLATDLAGTYKTSPFFALLWLNNFSHNNHNTPAAMDKRFELFFQELLTSGALNTTLVVFFSDHGTRFGAMRTTYMGWKEERLPFINLWVPMSFRRNYPESFKNLRENSDRLTSPYDLHLTLKDIIELKRVGSANNGSSGCPSCASLFTPISQDRGCSDAGIAPHWCSCGTQDSVSIKDSIVKEATQSIITKINERLTSAGNITKKCAKLKLSKILDARINVQSNHTKPLFDDYIIAFITTPGLAQFDATVRHFHQKVVPKFEVSFISRISFYGSKSMCVQNYLLKLYCHCI